MNIDEISFTGVIISFFLAIIVSYFTVYRINERYEYSNDRPKHLNRVRVFGAILSFLAAFVTSYMLFSVF